MGTSEQSVMSQCSYQSLKIVSKMYTEFQDGLNVDTKLLTIVLCRPKTVIQLVFFPSVIHVYSSLLFLGAELWYGS